MPPPPPQLTCVQQRADAGHKTDTTSLAWQGVRAITPPEDRPTLLQLDRVESTVDCWCDGQCSMASPRRRALVLFLPDCWTPAEAAFIRDDLTALAERVMRAERRQMPQTASYDIEHFSRRSQELLWREMLDYVQPQVRRLFPGLSGPWESSAHLFLGHVNVRPPRGAPNLQTLHRDSTFFTVICSLSDRNNFRGGGTFIASEPFSNTLNRTSQQPNSSLRSRRCRSS
jgi:hypothetical protein